MDKAIEYTQKLTAFVNALSAQNAQHNGSWSLETGRKFDKVYVASGNGSTGIEKAGRYMIDKKSLTIFGIKSWAQVNPRREFGTLDTVNQFDWSNSEGPLPRVGTAAETAHNIREASISANYRKRGRPRKIVATPLHIVRAPVVNTHGGQK